MTRQKPRIAILGAGIMGGCLAVYLARKGVSVTLFDKDAEPFSSASRWNEGKIHMGYLYAADPTLKSAKNIMTGGLHFRSLMEELLETSLEPAATKKNDIYLCHRASVVKPDVMESYMRKVTELLRAHPDFTNTLLPFSNHDMDVMSANELKEISGSDKILAGFRVPEYSVDTQWIAERFVNVLKANERIDLIMNTAVTGVAPSDNNKWNIMTSAGTFDRYDYVFNCLWEGKLAIDKTVGLMPGGVWSHRYRQSLFISSSKKLKTPNVVISTGPFGDVKNYDNGHFYLSWYPDGLRAESTELQPPQTDELSLPSDELLTESVFTHLSEYLPFVSEIRNHSETIRVGGGWVYAAGRGKLSDPTSSLHKRSSNIDVVLNSYFSIDTGKYSTAPYIARCLADDIFSN